MADKRGKPLRGRLSIRRVTLPARVSRSPCNLLASCRGQTVCACLTSFSPPARPAATFVASLPASGSASVVARVVRSTIIFASWFVSRGRFGRVIGLLSGRSAASRSANRRSAIARRPTQPTGALAPTTVHVSCEPFRQYERPTRARQTETVPPDWSTLGARGGFAPHPRPAGQTKGRPL